MSILNRKTTYKIDITFFDQDCHYKEFKQTAIFKSLEEAKEYKKVLENLPWKIPGFREELYMDYNSYDEQDCDNDEYYTKEEQEIAKIKSTLLKPLSFDFCGIVKSKWNIIKVMEEEIEN